MLFDENGECDQATIEKQNEQDRSYGYKWVRMVEARSAGGGVSPEPSKSSPKTPGAVSAEPSK